MVKFLAQNKVDLLTVKSNSFNREKLSKIKESHDLNQFSLLPLRRLAAHCFESVLDDDEKSLLHTDYLPVGDVIFEWVHNVKRGKRFGEVSIKAIKNWYWKEIDSSLSRNGELENTEHLSAQVMNGDILGL